MCACVSGCFSQNFIRFAVSELGEGGVGHDLPQRHPREGLTLSETSRPGQGEKIQVTEMLTKHEGITISNTIPIIDRAFGDLETFGGIERSSIRRRSEQYLTRLSGVDLKKRTRLGRNLLSEKI